MTISKIETIVPFKLLTSKHTQKGSQKAPFFHALTFRIINFFQQKEILKQVPKTLIFSLIFIIFV